MAKALKRCLAIQHVAFEDLDGFAGPIEDAGYRIDYVNAADGLAHVDASADLLCVLGGPIGACEEAGYPFLLDELSLIERQLRAERPLLGICLGAQLIARALGSRVYASGSKEIGFAPIELTESGRQSCLSPFAAGDPTLHWHGDTFDLPSGASLLASTPACMNQAFSLGPGVMAFQFHPEATGARIEHWLVGHAVEIAAAGLDVSEIRAEAAALAGRLEPLARTVASHWLAGLGDDAAASSF